MTPVYDVIVVGAGPGGISAATVAAEAGLRVCLLDDNMSLGGQIWRGPKRQPAEHSSHSREYDRWTARLRLTSCELWTGSRAIDRPAPDILRVEREGELRDVSFRKLILASGARERFLPFPGWTLPGVTGAGALQALSKAGLDVRGKRIVVAGSGPLSLAIAAGLTDAGAKIIAIYEQAGFLKLMGFGISLLRYPEKIVEGFGYRRTLRGVPYRTGCWAKQAAGSIRLSGVTITDGSREWTHDCDWLACGFHLVPNLELPMLMGCALRDGYVQVDALQQSSVADVGCVGELTGIGGLEKALLEGEVAGHAAAGHYDNARAFSSRLKRLRRFAQMLDAAFEIRDELRHLCAPKTIVCRCEDVDYSSLKRCGSWREAKLHTRCGMGACQGRICGPQTEFLFGWHYAGVRPPVFPVALSTLAADFHAEPNRDDRLHQDALD
jgi:D-hydroxyproline dehydrogenase subunit alpha